MVDIQTDPIKHQKVKKLRETNISNISVFNSKYGIGFEIPTPVALDLSDDFTGCRKLKIKSTELKSSTVWKEYDPLFNQEENQISLQLFQ